MASCSYVTGRFTLDGGGRVQVSWPTDMSVVTLDVLVGVVS